MKVGLTNRDILHGQTIIPKNETLITTDYNHIESLTPVDNANIICYPSKNFDIKFLLETIDRLIAENIDLISRVRYYEDYTRFLEKNFKGEGGSESLKNLLKSKCKGMEYKNE